MKRNIIMAAITISLCAIALNAQAQWGRGRGMYGFNQGNWNAPPWLNLTQDQVSSFDSLRRDFARETAVLSTEIESKRLALSSMLLETAPDAKKATSLQKEISDLESQYDEQQLNYRIKARTILTQEQIGQLPPGCTMGFGNMLCNDGPGYGCGYGGRHRGGRGPGCGRGWCW